MRLISFSLTTEQFRNRTKTCTRRLGWLNAKPGDLLMGCEQVMGLQGRPLVRLGVIVVVDVRREPLKAMLHDEDYGKAECIKEGFPDYSPLQFVWMFAENMKRLADVEVTRLEFRHLPGGRMS